MTPATTLDAPSLLVHPSRMLTHAMGGRRGAYLHFGLMVLIWGIHWPILKAVLHDMPPLTYAALRIGAALAAVVAVLAARGELARPPRADLRVLLVVSSQVAGMLILMNLALMVVPAGRSSILAYTTPFWGVIVQAVAFGAFVTRREAAGVGVGLLGIGILLNPGALDWSKAGALEGSLLLLFTAVLTAISVVVVRHHAWTTTPLRLLPWQLLLALLPAVGLALLFETGAPMHPTWLTLLAILFSGPVATAYTYWASQSVSRTFSPTMTTVGLLGVPVVGLASSALLLGERMSAIDLLGFAVTGVGIAVVSLAGRRKPAPRRVAEGAGG